jgi:tripartite-type tricarboxylate transporter receptor subunit TctC
VILPHRQMVLATTTVGIVIALLLAAQIGSVARAQTARTVKIVNAFAAGGAVDVLARILAEQVTRARGITMVVENRPGANGTIATEMVLRAAPDGNTLLFTAPDSLVIAPQLRKTTYDAMTSFEPVCKLVDTPAVIVVNNASPYRTLTELIDAARTKPGTITIASVGPAGSYHLAIEALKRRAKADLTFVPYPGSGPAITALLGGHVTSVLAAYPNAAEQIKAGELRAIAVATGVRAEALPNVPTIAELGYADFALENWFGTVAPAKTPKETVAELSSWFTAALQVPEAKERLVSLGLYPSGVCGSDFASVLRKQYEGFGRIIREANIKVE